MRCATGLLKSVSIIIPFCLLLATSVGAAELISIQNDFCSATVSPASLETHLKSGDRPAVLVSVAQTNLGRIADLQTTAARARWSLPDRKVTVTVELKDKRLLAHVLATDPGEFTFPVIPETAAAKGWILPFFEGVYAPGGDVKWQTFLTRRGELNTTADLTMPFLGLDCGGYTLTCILTNPFNNALEFSRAADARLHARLTHQFTRNHPVKEYGVVFQLGTNSLVEPARLYRQWLLERGEFVSLQDKIRRTPDAAKLPGAAHIYLWGHELAQVIQQLAAAGFDRLWLGSDGWAGFVNRPETVAAARKAGYLIGPYDSYHSIHRPGEPDTWETAQFGQTLYETGAIVKADGSKRRGFKQKGFLLSPDAARPYVEKRVSGLMAAFHANSWFVDCDGFGDYFDDYSEQHPATQQTDLQSRLSRMAWIRDTFGLVIGTEGCSAGVAPVIHFAHGVMTPVIGWGDPDLTNRQSKYYLGTYYPPDRPKVFFEPVPMKEEYRYIYFEPRFRLPLFQIAFHDSVIATHHWSFASLKAKDCAETVELLELLYQVPPLYHLNLSELQTRKEQLKRHYDFFSPLHRETALLPMTDFQWLTPDGTVQRTLFGNKTEILANFSSAPFQSGDIQLGKRSILVKAPSLREPRVYSPR